jgi:serine/threonine protein phosphatase PrpC
MHANSAIDDTLSGTTAITVLFIQDTLYVANVGDSRAIVATRNPETGEIQAAPLSDDQTPYRKVCFTLVRSSRKAIVATKATSFRIPVCWFLWARCRP